MPFISASFSILEAILLRFSWSPTLSSAVFEVQSACTVTPLCKFLPFSFKRFLLCELKTVRTISVTLTGLKASLIPALIASSKSWGNVPSLFNAVPSNSNTIEVRVASDNVGKKETEENSDDSDIQKKV